MVAFCVIAGCQGETIALLLQNMVAGAAVRSVDFLAPPPPEKDLASFLQSADFILMQPGGKGPLDYKSIAQQFPGKTLTIAELYFRGLHPDSCYIGHLADRFQTPSLYHSAAVLDAYLTGKSEKQALKSFELENFRRLGLLEAWDTSLEEMRRRDQETGVPAADFIEAYCREFPGFLAMNHPTIGLMHQYLALALKKLDVPFRAMNLASVKDPLAAHDVVPVLDEIAAHYGLPYRTSQLWLIEHLGRKFIGREEYIQRCYCAYEKADPDKLRVHSPMDLLAALRRAPALGHLAFLPP